MCYHSLCRVRGNFKQPATIFYYSVPYLIIKQAGTVFCHSLPCIISKNLLLYFVTACIVYSSSKLLVYFTSLLFCFVTRSLTLTAQPQPTVYWTHLHCSVQPSFFTNVALIFSELKSWTSLLIVPFPRSSLNLFCSFLCLQSALWLPTTVQMYPKCRSCLSQTVISLAPWWPTVITTSIPTRHRTAVDK